MKLHPLTVPYRILSRALQVGWAILIGLAVGSSGIPAGAWPFVIAGLVLLMIGGLVYEYVFYQRFDYELTSETLEITHGVLARRAREIPFRRIQNVDVTRTVVQRLLGIATVRIETAGGGSTEAELACVSVPEAERLQSEIRRRKEDATAEASEPTGPQTNVLYELDDRSLLAYSFLSFDPRIASGLLVLYPVLGPLVAGVGLGGLWQRGATVLVVFLAGLAILLLVAGIWLVSAAVRFVQFYGFRLTRAGDDLQYERGLFNRYTGTIPVDKIQTLAVTENVLMRQVGYATLAVETAGYAPGAAPAGGSEAAVPFATRDDVLTLAQTLEPFEAPRIERPPVRARRRYAGRYSILALLAVAGAFVANLIFGVPLWWLTLVLFPVAVAAGQFRWQHLGHDEQETHAVTRAGFWSRSTIIVPYDHLQTVVESESIFQRRWGLASVTYDTAGSGQFAGGNAIVHDIDAESTAGLVSHATDQLQIALRRD